MIDAADFYRRRRWLYDTMTALIGYKKSIRGFFHDHQLSVAGKKVLDAGCGSGALVKALYDPSSAFFGFDLTPAMLDQFRAWTEQKELTNVFFQQANAFSIDTDLPKDWTQFDFVISSGMLEYLPKEYLADVLASFRRRLASDGKLVLFISRDRLFNALWLKRFWKANLYKKQELADAFTSAGFHEVQILPFKTWAWAIVAA